MKTDHRNQKTKDKKGVKGFRVLEDECIWMKAGVINFRKCDNNFDCSTCAFDRGMRRAMEIESGQDSAAVAPRWVSHLKEKYPGPQRPCRHTLTGRFPGPKICISNYECHHCAFDQMLDEMDFLKETGPLSYRSASGYRMAVGYYYHPGHSWTRFDQGGRVRVGLDDFLVKVFGVPGSLDLPPLGKKLRQGRPGWQFASSGHSATIPAPVNGTVLALNYGVWEHPEILGADPYNHGWLMIVEPAAPKKDLKGLYYGKESLVWMERESQRLLGLMGPAYERLAATGAEPIQSVRQAFPEITWEVLVRQFIRSEKISAPGC